MDDWVHRRREKRALSRGKLPGIIPYIGYGSPTWVRVLGRVLYLRPETAVAGAGDTDTGRGPRENVRQVSRVRGWRSFTSLHVPFHPVSVLIDGERVTEIVSDRGGVLDSIVQVTLDPGWHTVTLQTGSGPGVDAPVFVADPAARFGIVSDVDDTILNTALPKPLVAAWNSFVADEHARTSTPGMPVLYDHLVTAHPGAPVIYLSTGAWNVAPVLTRFLERNLYPAGPLLLTDWGPTPDRWFRSGKEHKLRELDRLAREFPEVRWLLIGDDGQHDEQLYDDFASRHPGNVAAIAIRQLSPGQAVLAGGRAAPRGQAHTSDVPRVYGSDGAILQEALMRLDIL
ncbi:MAG: DUF2183 domain-containing protein [Leucobacter sp.]|nr:DUF2183 domain-containing protein [Leucobacter sp.]